MAELRYTQAVSNRPRSSPLAPLRETSGDPLADGRYTWALAAVADGDHSGATDLLVQVIELVPDWAPAWFALGEARQRLDDPHGAAQAFLTAQRHDRAGRLGADLRLAALGAASAPAQPAPAYLRQLFDQYAPQFEEHLVDRLGYRGPQLVEQAMASVAARLPPRFRHAIDVGCGTGLVARMIVAGGACERISGIDISPQMIARARETGLYDRLIAGEAVQVLASEPSDSADLIVAADTLVYIGDLAPLFGELARVLMRGGVFAFTAQTGPAGRWDLGADLRYRHAPAYLRALAEGHGFDVPVLTEESARNEHGAAVPGLVGVMLRA